MCDSSMLSFALRCVIHASTQFLFAFSSCRFGFSPQVLEAFRHGDEELLKAYPGEDPFCDRCNVTINP